MAERTPPPLRGPPPSTLSVWAAALSLPLVVPLQAQKALLRGGLRAEGIPKRRFHFESVAAGRRI